MTIPQPARSFHLGVDLVGIVIGLMWIRCSRRLRAAEARATLASGFSNSATGQLTDANRVIRSLEETVADTSRLLTDALGTIGVLEQRMADADLQRDVALATCRSSHARIGELELHALDVETQLAVAQQAGADLEARLAAATVSIDPEERLKFWLARDQTIADLEARLRLPEPTPADLVLLDAATRPERLQDAAVAVPEGCRVETVRYHAQTRVRGPGGKFVRLAGQVEPSNDFVVGRDRKEGWA